MYQPKGFVAPDSEKKVCRLIKSLYDLKQTLKQWYEKFDMTIISFGFIVSEFDKCVYYKVRGDECIVLCLYVDDILLFGNTLRIVNETKLFLSGKFEMKDMGEAKVILGLTLNKSTSGIAISQSHYVEKVLEKFGYQNCKSVCTPYDPSKIYNKNKTDTPVSQLRYSQLI